MREANQLRLVVHPIIYRVLPPSHVGCLGFLPSTVSMDKNLSLPSDLRFHRLDFDDSGGASCTPGATWCQCSTRRNRGFQCWNLTTKGMNQIWKIFLLYENSVEFLLPVLTLCLATAVGDNLPVTDNLST